MLNPFKSLFQTKSSVAGSVIALHTAGRPQWTARNYAAMAREGFAGNVVGYRCVRMMAEAAASVPLLTYVNGEEVAEHPVVQLLSRPNPSQSGRDLLDQLYAFLMVAGNAYAELVVLDGAPREMFALRPDRMSIVPLTHRLARSI